MKLIPLLIMALLVSGCNFNSKENSSTETSTKLPPPAPDEGVEKTSADPEGEGYLLQDREAGNFAVGENIPESGFHGFSISKENQTRTTEEGPTEETVFVVRRDGNELLQLLPGIAPGSGETTSKIGEIRIVSEDFTTAEGIGVGSTLEEFMAAYPDYEIWYTYVSDMYVIETGEIKAQFLLEEAGFTGEMEVESAVTPLKKEDFKKGTEIIRIRMI